MKKSNTLIGVQVIAPSNKRERAYAREYYCDVSDCPLMARAECINANPWSYCEYGSVKRVDGYTSRARAYRSWLKEWQAKRDEFPIQMPSEERVQKIGDYYWVPYNLLYHSDNKGVGLPFIEWSHIISSGRPFVPAADFTAENIAMMINAKPRGFVDNRPLSKYEQETLPGFFSDLREYDRELFDRVVEIDARALEYANMGSAFSVSLEWLNSINWSGYATINGHECFVYTSGRVRIEGLTTNEFPGLVIEDAKLELPGDIEVWPSMSHYKALSLKTRAEREGAIVSTA